MFTMCPKIDENFIPKVGGQLGNKIPMSVLREILCVYEKGKEEDLKKIPNNLICDPNGNFWITWEEVFLIRSQIERDSYNAILFRKFNGDKRHG